VILNFIHADTEVYVVVLKITRVGTEEYTGWSWSSYRFVPKCILILMFIQSGTEVHKGW